MSEKQQLFAIIISFMVFIITIDLVRKKRLREEYSLLWLGTSLCMIVLIFRYDWLLHVTRLIGAVLPTTTLFLGSILFLVLLAVQFSIKISKLSNQVKDLVQENALLRYEFDKSRLNEKNISAQSDRAESKE